MIDLNDFIRNKHNGKKYKFYCDECGKYRGYLFKTAHGGRKTGDYCLDCKNSVQSIIKTNGYCTYCSKNHELPLNNEKDNVYWYLEINSNSTTGGYLRCKVALVDKNKKWIKDNPEKHKLKLVKASAKRRAAKLNATPDSLTKEE